MRIWDVSPGYLNRQSLLGEHRELHGLCVILAEGRRGYARHPETLRWVGALDALAERHAHLAAEMRLRGYVDRTPVPLATQRVVWPEAFVTAPWDQVVLLKRKYIGKAAGRLRLPRDVQQLWAQHKYSVMARDPALARSLGRSVARTTRRDAAIDLSRDLVLALRGRPSLGRVANAIDHMWGHVRRVAGPDDRQTTRDGLSPWLATIQRLAVRHREPYLLASTALAELAVYTDTFA